MDFTSEQYEMARDNLRLSTIGSEAPLILVGTLLELVGAQTPVASLCDVKETRQEDQPLTTWRAAWLTSTHLLYVSAAKRLNAWNSSDIQEGGGVPDELEAWSRPLNQTVALEVGAASVSRPKESKDFEWDFVHQVAFHDGTRIDVPLFGNFPDDHLQRQAVQAFWAKLRDSW